MSCGNVVVFDLDGTLIRVNSFHRWLYFCAARFLRCGQFISLLLLLKAIALRMTRRRTHGELKREVLRLTRDLGRDQIDVFVTNLIRYTNPRVISALRECQGRHDLLVLASAAPDLYVAPLATRLGFGLSVATSMDVEDPQWEECIEETKARRVLALLERHGRGVIDDVFTDHHQDMPLIRMSRRWTLVNPSPRTTSVLAQHGFGACRVID